MVKTYFKPLLSAVQTRALRLWRGVQYTRDVRLVLVVRSLLFSSAAVCQSPACPEAQTLQSLLTEVHQLRQDLQTVSLAARKAQILIDRLYVQEAIVQRVSENLNNAKTALDRMQAD